MTQIYVRIIINLTKREQIFGGVRNMILQRLWKNYCYVILLIVISIAFSFVYVFTMTDSSNIEQENQNNDSYQQVEYAIEWNEHSN